MDIDAILKAIELDPITPDTEIGCVEPRNHEPWPVFLFQIHEPYKSAISLIPEGMQAIRLLRAMVTEVRRFHETFDARLFVEAERLIARVDGKVSVKEVK